MRTLSGRREYKKYKANGNWISEKKGMRRETKKCREILKICPGDKTESNK